MGLADEQIASEAVFVERSGGLPLLEMADPS